MVDSEQLRKISEQQGCNIVTF